jgi:hypothetical protein
MTTVQGLHAMKLYAQQKNKQNISVETQKELNKFKENSKKMDDLKKLISIIYTELKPYKKFNMFYRQGTIKPVSTPVKKNNNNHIQLFMNNKNIVNEDKFKIILLMLISFIAYNYGISLNDELAKKIYDNILKKYNIQITSYRNIGKIIYKIYNLIRPSINQTLEKKPRNYGKSLTRIFMNENNPGINSINSYTTSLKYDPISFLIYVITYYYDIWLTTNEIMNIRKKYDE